MTQSMMEQEALQTASVVERQLKRNSAGVEKLGSHLKHLDPKMVMLIGRGSSDHAGVFAKYLIEVELNIPTFAAAPSVSSVYKQQLRLQGGVAILGTLSALLHLVAVWSGNHKLYNEFK